MRRKAHAKSRNAATLLLLVALVVGLLGVGGCASAGLMMAGPVVAGFYVLSDRTVERTLAADLAAAWTATRDALTRLEIRVREADRGAETWVLEGTGEKISVRAELTPVTPRLTRLSVRVEAGRLLADKLTGEEILKQVAVSLAGATALARGEPSREPGAQREALAALEREIRRLRSELEEMRGAVRAPPEPAEAASAVLTERGSGILVIPASSGVPTLPVPANGAAGPVQTPSAVDVRAEGLRTSRRRGQPRGEARNESAPVLAGGLTANAPKHEPAAPLSRAGTMSPVPALAGRRGER
ncbi:MAG: DUF3568 family protein [Candidatus Rokubacteria bacterium]|nr:DUF3568 family protein [Candidatus Rokubacteria bacterium]